METDTANCPQAPSGGTSDTSRSWDPRCLWQRGLLSARFGPRCKINRYKRFLHRKNNPHFCLRGVCAPGSLEPGAEARSPWCRAETRAPLGKRLHPASQAEKPRAASGRRRTGRCRCSQARASREKPPRRGEASLGRARLRKPHRHGGPRGAGVRAHPPPPARALRAARPVVRKETIKRPFLPHPGRGGRCRCREDNEQRPLPALPGARQRPPRGTDPTPARRGTGTSTSTSRRPSARDPPPAAGTTRGGKRAPLDWPAASQGRPVCWAPIGSSARWPRPAPSPPLAALARWAPPCPPPLRGHLSLWRK